MKRTPLSVHSRVWIIRIEPLSDLVTLHRLAMTVIVYSPFNRSITQSLNHTICLRLVCGAAIARIVGHRRPSAHFTDCGNGKNARLRFIVLHHVLFADIVRSENRYDVWRRCCFLHTRAPLGLLALDQAHRPYDVEAKFACGFDRLHGGGSRGADVIYNHYARAFFAEAFDALPGAVLLLGLAHQESVEFAAYHRNRYHDRVGTHRKAANGLRLPSALVDFFQENFPGEARSLGVEGGRAAVDVVIAGAAGRQLELT